MKVDLTNVQKRISEVQEVIAKLEAKHDYVGVRNTLEKFEQYVAGFMSTAKIEAMKNHIAIGAVKNHEAGVERDVHTEHCCIVHGCKYGKDDICTVTTKKATQSFPCQSCRDAMDSY